MARILLADDDVEFREIYVTALEADNNTVVAVADGALALERFKQESFDLVITDNEMPNLSGVQLTAAIRAHEGNKIPSTPVLMITGKDFSCDAVLVKPFSPRVLVLLAQVLQKKH